MLALFFGTACAQGQAVSETDKMLEQANVYMHTSPSDVIRYEMHRQMAEGLYRSVLQRNPAHAEANFRIGMIYFRQAVEIINNFSELDPVFPEDPEDIRMAMGLMEKALPFMLESYKVQPRHLETLTALSQIYFALGDYEQSERYMVEAGLVMEENKNK